MRMIAQSENRVNERSRSGEKLTQSLSENLLTLLALDDKNGRLVYGMVTPELFSNDIHQLLARRMFEYWRDHNKPPGKAHTADLVADIIDDPRHPQARTFKTMIMQMIVLYDNNINTAFVIDQVRAFIRLQEFNRAVMETAEQLDSRKQLAIPDVEQLWDKLLRQKQVPHDLGLRLGDLDQMLAYLDQHAKPEFELGIAALDRNGISPERGTLMTLLAATGGGKSWFLCHCARRALRQGKKVLFVTLELSDKAVQIRCWQNLYGIAWKDDVIETNITTLQLDRDKRLIGLRTKSVEAEFSLRHPKLKAKLQPELKRDRFDNVRIKYFPARTLTVPQLRACLDQLEIAENFVPDIVLLDHLGLMQTKVEHHRVELGLLTTELRGLAIERNVALVTAQQINRESQNAKLITRQAISEDFSIVQTSDFVLTLNRLDKEKQCKLARIWVDKGRQTTDNFGAVISQNFDHGMFLLNSAPWTSSYQGMLEALPEPPVR